MLREGNKYGDYSAFFELDKHILTNIDKIKVKIVPGAEDAYCVVCPHKSESCKRSDYDSEDRGSYYKQVYPEGTFIVHELVERYNSTLAARFGSMKQFSIGKEKH